MLTLVEILWWGRRRQEISGVPDCYRFGLIGRNASG
jgi:hypothetical protein